MFNFRSVVTWLKRHLGRRGAALLFFAVLDVVIAYSLWIDGRTAQAIPAYRLLFRYVPPWGWAIFWLVVGVTCGIQAWMRHDDLAFAAAIVLKLTWGGGIFAVWLLDDVPRAWLGAVIWFAFAAFIAVISGWPEPEEHPTGGSPGAAA